MAKEAYEQMLASAIFNKDENFLFPRIAFYSDFGDDQVVDDGIGIWQTTKDNLEDAKKVLF